MDAAIKNEPEKTVLKFPNNDFISKALRRVVSEEWQKMSTDQKFSQILNEHASRMEELLKSFDYGAICMPNIISNSKKMSHRELISYLSLVESLGIGYTHWFGSDFANIYLAGLTLKARDTRSLSKYLNNFLTRMETKANYFETRALKENKTIDELITELERKSKGPLRFLRKGEINALRRMIKMRYSSNKRYLLKRAKYSKIVTNVKSHKPPLPPIPSSLF